MPETIFLTDGAMDFVGGVDSGKVPLIASPSNPNGLPRDHLAWATNSTVRGGAISPRTGWKYLTTIADGQSLYQGGYLYEPINQDPYLWLTIGGQVLTQRCVAGAAPFDFTALTGLGVIPTVDQTYFCQAEDLLVIQDGVQNPLFWIPATNTFRRSNGIIASGNPANEIPVATAMDYYGNRIWYVQNYRTTSAGDIFGGAHTILSVTENPLAAAGDGFAIPTSAGPIRALAHSAAIDTALGQGQLFVFTRKNIFALSVPLTRADWTSTTETLQKVIQKKYGTPAERSIVSVNGDLFYQTMEPGIRTLALAVRYFNQWANTPISRNLNRLIPFQDRALLRFGSGMLFDNRLYETCLPYNAGPVGVAHSALAVLDFDLVSSFENLLRNDVNAIPSWEGIHDGLSILQVFSGDFGGLDRAFAVVMSTVDGTIQLWEMTSGDRFENGDNRITWQFETPAFDWKDPFQFKELQGGQLWMDRWSGKVDILVEYRSDDDPCWHFWAQFNKCYARSSCEDLKNPVCYPITPYGEGNEKPLSLPHPNLKECASNSSRPAGLGYVFQLRITLQGAARVRGFLLYASKRQLSLYSNQVC